MKKKKQRQQEQQKQTNKQAKNKPLFSPNSPQKKIICNVLRTFQLKVTVTLISGDKME